MSQPQQPELRRSGRGKLDPKEAHRKEQAATHRRERDAMGPVPEENRQGHRPERDQDKPEA